MSKKFACGTLSSLSTSIPFLDLHFKIKQSFSPGWCTFKTFLVILYLYLIHFKTFLKKTYLVVVQFLFFLVHSKKFLKKTYLTAVHFLFHFSYILSSNKFLNISRKKFSCFVLCNHF